MFDLKQLKKLNDLIRNAHAKNCEEEGLSCKISNTKSELASPSLQAGLEDGGDFARKGDDIMKNNFVEDLGQQQVLDELVAANTSQENDASLASLESWYRPDEQGIVFDQLRGCSQWLNFWS